VLAERATRTQEGAFGEHALPIAGRHTREGAFGEHALPIAMEGNSPTLYFTHAKHIATLPGMGTTQLEQGSFEYKRFFR
jgi:hypothetical protein